MSANVMVATRPSPFRFQDKATHGGFQLPVETAFKGPPIESRVERRPRHTRRKSSRGGDSHPLQAIRAAFKRVLPRAWSAEKGFTALALEFYRTCIGVTAGTNISNFNLSYLETVMLALELSHAVNTSNVLLLLNEASAEVLILHTHMLNIRMDHFASRDATVFARRVDNHFVMDDSEKDGVFNAPFDFLGSFLRESTRQCVQTSEFGWSPFELEHKMGFLSSWLLEHPVVCLVHPADDDPAGKEAESFWTLHVRLEGHEPRYDHSFTMGDVPNSLVMEGNDSANSSRRSSLSIDDSIYLADLQDRVQSTLFDRLNAAEASTIWADVSCEFVASQDNVMFDP